MWHFCGHCRHFWTLSAHFRASTRLCSLFLPRFRHAMLCRAQNHHTTHTQPQRFQYHLPRNGMERPPTCALHGTTRRVGMPRTRSTRRRLILSRNRHIPTRNTKPNPRTILLTRNMALLRQFRSFPTLHTNAALHCRSGRVIF